MDDLDEDSEEEEKDLSYIRLACDLEPWNDIKIHLKELQNVSNSEHLNQKLNNLENLINNIGTQEGNTIQYFLDEICTEKERNYLLHNTIPYMVDYLLKTEKVQPFIRMLKSREGNSEIRNLHPDFVICLLAHSFFSLTSSRKFNLNIQNLHAKNPKTHYKLKCYFDFFSNQIQKKNKSIIKYTKEVLPRKQVQYIENILECKNKLKQFNIVNRVEEDNVNNLQIVYCDNLDFSQHKLNSFGEDPLLMENLPALIPLLYTSCLSDSESIRVSLPDNKNVSLVKRPKHIRSKTDILSSMKLFYVSMKPVSPLDENIKSILRRPSVDAITSVFSNSSFNGNSTDSVGISVSDSCGNNKSASENSYDLLQNETVRHNLRKDPKTKIKRKQSFQERLQAALERGNTPDESDDQSYSKQPTKKSMQTQKRVIKRKKSTSVMAFNGQREESDDFFTATEDEQSNKDTHTSVDSRNIRATTGSKVPIMRRKLLKDTSFDISTSSCAEDQVLMSGSPLTGTSELFSDNSSFLSAELGMPQLNSENMEDLCDTLEGFCEVTVGGSKLRNEQLHNMRTFMPLLRSFSDTFLHLADDLDRIPFISFADSFKSCVTSLSGKDCSLESMGALSYSSVAITSKTKSIIPDPDSLNYINCISSLPAISMSICEEFNEADKVFFLIWWAASSLLDDSPSTSINQTFNTQGNPYLTGAEEIVNIVIASKISIGALLGLIIKFVDSKENEDNIFMFIKNTLN